MWHSEVGRIAVTVAVAYFTGYYDGGVFGANGAFASAGLTGNSLAIANGAAGGFAGGFVGSGGDFKSGVIGGLTGAAMGYVGGEFPGYGENVAAHAAVGCASSSLSGGNCGSGALAGGFSAAAAPLASDLGVVGGAIASTVIGGTASVLGGGKFANGAATGAFGYLFNYCSHDGNCTTKLEKALWDWMPGYKFGTCLSVGDCTAADWARATGDVAIGVVGGVEVKGAGWALGAFKSEAKWAAQMESRGWTAAQISEALQLGESVPAVNMVNKANEAMRFIHPQTGQSVVIDTMTREVLHVGGKGFKY